MDYENRILKTCDFLILVYKMFDTIKYKYRFLLSNLYKHFENHCRLRQLFKKKIYENYV